MFWLQGKVFQFGQYSSTSKKLVEFPAPRGVPVWESDKMPIRLEHVPTCTEMFTSPEKIDPRVVPSQNPLTVAGEMLKPSVSPHLIHRSSRETIGAGMAQSLPSNWTNHWLHPETSFSPSVVWKATRRMVSGRCFLYNTLLSCPWSALEYQFTQG